MESLDTIIRILNTNQTIDVWASLITLSLSFLCGIVIGYVYRINFVAFTIESQFSISLVAVCMIVSVIMIVIGSNVTLSLGLIGALSIVRFRAAIKSTMDMVYLFWAIGTGLAIGAMSYLIAVLSLVGIGCVLILLKRLNIFESFNSAYIVTWIFNAQNTDDAVNIMDISPQGVKLELKSSIFDFEQGQHEVTYAVTFKRPQFVTGLLAELEAHPSTKSVTVLQPETNLFV